MHHELLATAHNEQSKYLAHLSLDEIHAWLVEELWTAIITFDPKKGSLRGYWWSCWLNRRRKLITHTYTHAYRFNRNALYQPKLGNDHGEDERETLEEAVSRLAMDDLSDQIIPDCPVGSLLEWRVWRMLAVSTIRTETDRAAAYSDICDTLDIPPELLTEILETFRNSMIYRHLTGGM